MADEWIYGAPPPPPIAEATGSVSARSSSNRGNRGRGRYTQTRPRVPQFQPAMQFPQASTTEPRYHTTEYVSPIIDSEAHIAVRSPGTLNTSSSNTKEVQYNSAGYALSSTYDSSQQLTTPPSKPSSTAKIQGTNISLETPEDIAAWIAERKKKWPTTANVEKKIAERKLPVDARSSKKRKIRHEPQSRQHNHHQSSSNLPQVQSDATTSGPQETHVANTADSSTNIPANKPIQVSSSSLDIALAALSGDIPVVPSNAIADAYDENVDEMTGAPAAPDHELVQAIARSGEHDDSSSDVSSVVSSDTSSDSSDNDSSDDEIPTPTSSKIAPPDPSIEVPRTSETFARPRRPCKYFKQGRCTRGDSCTYSHAQTPQQARSTQSRPAQRIDDRYKWRKRKSLYDRLVENELEQERAQQVQQAKDGETAPVES